MPPYSAVRMWIHDDRHGFRARYHTRNLQRVGSVD
jgi:hypothetical protein